MLASVGSFLYKRHIDTQLQDRIGELSQAISGFSESDMEQVRGFNVRLSQTRERLDNSASVRAVFEAMEDATAQSVSLSELKLERLADSSLEVAAKVETKDFDSSLFQRGVFERSSIVETVEVEDLTITEAANTDDGPVEAGVSFVAKITVPISEVPNIPTLGQTIEPVVIEEVVATTSADVVESEVVETEDVTTEANEITP
jgi:hypothetical protein